MGEKKTEIYYYEKDDQQIRFGKNKKKTETPKNQNTSEIMFLPLGLRYSMSCG
jgi:hypothetical protein